MTKIRPSTRDAIVEAAFQVFNKQPASSLEDIARAAGVGRATLHRHFSSRAALMNALAHIAMEELTAATDQALRDATSHSHGLRLAMEAMIPLANRQWFLMNEDMEDDPDLRASYEADVADLRQSIEAAKDEGTFDRNVPTVWIVETYQGLIYTAWTMVREGECTAKQAADLAWRTLEHGLKEH